MPKTKITETEKSNIEKRHDGSAERPPMEMFNLIVYIDLKLLKWSDYMFSTIEQ